MNRLQMVAFFDELEKIGQEADPQVRELIEDLTPAPKGMLERVMPLGATIGGTLGGAATGGALGARGWRGLALKGLGGTVGGLTGLSLGGAGQKAMIQDRQLDAYRQLMGGGEEA